MDQKNNFDEKNRVLTDAVKHLFNTISDEDVLRQLKTGEWMIEDKTITKAEADIVIAQAKNFLESKLWNVLQRDVKWQSGKAMFTGSKDMMDVAMGKMMLYVLDIISTRLRSLSSGNGYFNKK